MLHIDLTSNHPGLSAHSVDVDGILLIVYEYIIMLLKLYSLSTLPDMNTITSDIEPLQPFDISELDVYNALINLDADKALGINGIGPKVLKHCAESLV